MGGLALLTDFGSTYTKVCAVALGSGMLIGRAQAATTVDTDIARGWRQAVECLTQQCGVDLSDVSVQLACSSAGGGLRMVVVGYVPRLTSKAGQIAALGAGAKLVGCYSYRLTDSQVAEIRNLSPDILLLCGGTDGGDTATVLANARKLAVSGPDCIAVFAGNAAAAEQVADLYRRAGRQLRVTENVMPEVGEVNTRGISELIRKIFTEHVIRAKGIDRVKELTGGIVMPTPAAVFAGLELLSAGVKGQQGLGELMAVDVGGATTDVYSFCQGKLSRSDIIPRGLREPYGKRTVEGDIGVRLNAPSVVAAVEELGFSQDDAFQDRNLKTLASSLPNRRAWLPSTEEEETLDALLACGAVAIAVRRHAGRLSEVYTGEGIRWLQEGKDLSELGVCIGTGGPLVHHRRGIGILEKGLEMAGRDPLALVPKRCVFLLDRHYCMYAVGLLRDLDPSAAFRLACNTVGVSEHAELGQRTVVTDEGCVTQVSGG